MHLDVNMKIFDWQEFLLYGNFFISPTTFKYYSYFVGIQEKTDRTQVLKLFWSLLIEDATEADDIELHN